MLLRGGRRDIEFEVEEEVPAVPDPGGEGVFSMSSMALGERIDRTD